MSDKKAERFWGVDAIITAINAIKNRMTRITSFNHPQYHMHNLEVSMLSFEKHFVILRKKVRLLKKQLEDDKLLNYYVCEDCDRIRYTRKKP